MSAPPSEGASVYKATTSSTILPPLLFTAVLNQSMNNLFKPITLAASSKSDASFFAF